MVYYVSDEVDEDCSVIVHLKLRDLYDMEDDVEESFMESKANISQDLASLFLDDNECMQLAREYVANKVKFTMDLDSYMNLD